MIFSSDISKYRQTALELPHSHALLEKAQQLGKLGSWEPELPTGMLPWPEEASRTFEFDQTRFLPSDGNFLRAIHPEDRERVLTLREEYLQGKTLHYEVEYRMRNKAGDWRWILSRGRAVARDEQGRALRIIGSHTDITRLKKVEAELKRAQAELENRVKERTNELSEANIALTVLLKKREEDRAILAEEVLSNTTKLVEPLLDRLKESRLTKQQETLVDILRANIKELTSPFANKFSTKLARLTSMEIQVANMVKLGKQTKEIAEIMNLSSGTINIHRKNIRKKLDMTHKKINLQTTLSHNF